MSTGPRIIAVLYTQDLRGDIRFLPKLARVLMRLRLEDRRTLTVDLGGACAPDVWHCQATDGRSMLVALDGLNYAAANVDGLRDSVRPNLYKSITNMQAVDAAFPGKIPGARFFTRLPEGGPPEFDGVTLVITPSEQARIEGGVVYFPAIERYKVGRMRIRTDGTPALVGVETLDVPDDTPPDGTISGMVDFIENEARQYQKRRQGT